MTPREATIPLPDHLRFLPKYYQDREGQLSRELRSLIWALSAMRSRDAAHVLESYAFDTYVIESLMEIGDKRCVPLLKRIIDQNGEYPEELLTQWELSNLDFESIFNSERVKKYRFEAAELEFFD